MPITDTHVHFWDTTARRHPWLDDEPALNGPRLPSDLDLDAVPQVSRIVLVEADCRPEDSLDEARWFAALQRTEPRIAAIVADVVLDSPSLAERLDELAAIELVTGVRHLFQGQPAGHLTDPAVLAGAAEVAARGLTFDACIQHQQLPELIEFARAVPQLTIVLDHLAKPSIATGGIEPWATHLAGLAACPNVHAKVSGVAPEADPDTALWPQARPFIDELVRRFGADRLLLGSDWPVSTSGTGDRSYPAWWQFLTDEVLAGLGAEELAKITHRNADRIYLPGTAGQAQSNQEEEVR